MDSNQTCSFHLAVDVSRLSLQVCLQMFQLLSREIAALVWDKQHSSPTVQTVLQALLEIILGKVFSSHIISLVEIFFWVLIQIGVSCLTELQQGRSSPGWDSCSYADQHGTREWSWRSCSMESHAGVPLRYTLPTPN